ncbi:MAG: RND family transporter [SAR324 cluster bacterium]|nr:RND family transporter [SAR324 cluster bacterium]
MAINRKMLNTGFENLGRGVYRNRWKVLAVMLIIFAGLATQLRKVQFDTSTESFFSKTDPILVDYEALREQFGREEVVIIGISPPEVFDVKFLRKLVEFHDAIEKEVPFKQEVTSLANVRNTRGEGDVLIIEDLLKNIPQSPAEMAELRQRVFASRLYPNFLISKDGTLTTVIIETLAYSPEKSDGDDLDGFDDEDSAGESADGKGEARAPLSVEENKALFKAMYIVMDRFRGPDFPMVTLGQPLLSDYFQRTMQKDMATFLMLAMLTIAVLLMVLFRRISGVVLPLIVVILSFISTVGVMAATGTPFTMTTFILPSFILATGVGATVHLLAIFFRRYAQRGDKEEALIFAMGHSGLPILMTSLTTSAGLFAFATVKMPPVAHMGIFAGIGVLIALVYTLVLIPAALSLWPMRPIQRGTAPAKRSALDRALVGVGNFAVDRAVAVVIAGGLLMVLSAVGMASLRFSVNFFEYLPKTSALRQANDLFDQKMGGAVRLAVVIDTGRENGQYEPAVMNNIDALERFAKGYRLKRDGAQVVSNTVSLVNIVKETNQALNGNDAEFYAIPQERAAIAQELLLFENSRSDDRENFVDSLFSKSRLSITVPTRDASDYVEFVRDIRAEGERLFGDDARVSVTGLLHLFSSMISAMMVSMAQSYIIASVVITFMMIVLIGSVRIGLLSMVANFFPILITLGVVMGFAGIRLDMFNLMIGGIALGLAVDDTIHFFHNFRAYYGEYKDVRRAVQETFLSAGRAMVFTTLVLVAGFWLFMFGTMNNIFYFGLLTGTTLIFALLSDFLLAPAMLELVIRTKYGRTLAEKWSTHSSTA